MQYNKKRFRTYHHTGESTPLNQFLIFRIALTITAPGETGFKAEQTLTKPYAESVAKKVLDNILCEMIINRYSVPIIETIYINREIAREWKYEALQEQAKNEFQIIYKDLCRDIPSYIKNYPERLL
jgi:hypothetical protein